MAKHLLNQDFRARETSEFNPRSSLAPKCHPKETTIKVKSQGMQIVELSQDTEKLLKPTQDYLQLTEREAMRDHQSIQKVLMFMPIRTKLSMLNRNIKHQVIKKTPQQTFPQDPK